MAQQQVAPPSTPYGLPISFEVAKRATAAAEAEAIKNNWWVAIAVVDSGGNLVILHRLDNAQLSSGRIAEAKARTSVEFRRPTKALEDAVAGGAARSVYPSGAAFATASAPRVCPEPGRFSTMTGWPHLAASLSATIRGIVSAAAPAGTGTTILMSRFG